MNELMKYDVLEDFRAVLRGKDEKIYKEFKGTSTSIKSAEGDCRLPLKLKIENEKIKQELRTFMEAQPEDVDYVFKVEGSVRPVTVMVVEEEGDVYIIEKE
ncbi:hypothetical protein [Bacillus pumilus]|uniref:hypothetical protein n=1 Tax=Bacillus pumilus TaxID=1408 RepID=UPI001C22F525|nr:hypothetical protein [Bacillus pumilus]MBU8573670.1 hypothetical protein [Bacillus pumilus]